MVTSGVKPSFPFSPLSPLAPCGPLMLPACSQALFFLMKISPVAVLTNVSPSFPSLGCGSIFPFNTSFPSRPDCPVAPSCPSLTIDV